MATRTRRSHWTGFWISCGLLVASGAPMVASERASPLFDLDGTWKGKLTYLTGPGLVEPPPYTYEIRLKINGHTVLVDYRIDDEQRWRILDSDDPLASPSHATRQTQSSSTRTQAKTTTARGSRPGISHSHKPRRKVSTSTGIESSITGSAAGRSIQTSHSPAPAHSHVQIPNPKMNRMPPA